MLHIYEQRSKYNDIYVINFDKKINLIFKALTYAEYVSAISITETYPQVINNEYEDIKERIFKDQVLQFTDIESGIIYIKDIEDEMLYDIKTLLEVIPAGVVEVFYETILKLSSPGNVKEFEESLNISRNINSADIISIILSLTSSVYKIDVDELKNKSWPTILSMYATAESILSNQIPQLPLSIEDPDDRQN